MGKKKKYSQIYREVREEYEEKPAEKFHRISDYTGLVLGIIMILIANIFFGFSITKGESMYPNVRDNESYFFMKQPMINYDKLEQGDLVMIQLDDGSSMLKRLIAFKGDIVEIVDGLVYVNNELVEIEGIDRTGWEQYANVLNRDPMEVEGDVYVLGDNMPESHDSRHMDHFYKEDVIGKVIFRMVPLIRF